MIYAERRTSQNSTQQMNHVMQYRTALRLLLLQRFVFDLVPHRTFPAGRVSLRFHVVHSIDADSKRPSFRWRDAILGRA